MLFFSQSGWCCVSTFINVWQLYIHSPNNENIFYSLLYITICRLITINYITLLFFNCYIMWFVWSKYMNRLSNSITIADFKTAQKADECVYSSDLLWLAVSSSPPPDGMKELWPAGCDQSLETHEEECKLFILCSCDLP